MMNLKTANPVSKRITRLVTLLAFFSFSGLNNGFTYFVISAGRVQKVDVTTALVEKSARFLNPANWKNTLSNIARNRLFGSAKVIEFASQRAVQNFLFESSLMQVWLRGSFSKILGAPNQSISGQIARRGDSKKVRGNDVLPAGEGSTFSLASNDSNGVKVRTEEARKYLRSGQRDSWLSDRHHFWSGKNHGAGFSAFFALAELLQYRSRGDPSPDVRASPRRSVTFLTNKMGERRIFASADGEADSNARIVASAELTSPGFQDQGSFFAQGQTL